MAVNVFALKSVQNDVNTQFQIFQYSPNDDV